MIGAIKKMKEAVTSMAHGKFTEIEVGSSDEFAESYKVSNSIAKYVIKESVKKMQIAEKKYKNLYDDSPELYRTIDTNGIILDVNNSYAKALGYSKEEVIGKSIFDHTQEEKISPLKNSFDIWKKSGVVTDKEIRMKRKNGTSLPALLSANTMYDSEGNLVVV